MAFKQIIVQLWPDKDHWLSQLTAARMGAYDTEANFVCPPMAYLPQAGFVKAIPLRDLLKTLKGEVWKIDLEDDLELTLSGYDPLPVLAIYSGPEWRSRIELRVFKNPMEAEQVMTVTGWKMRGDLK